MFHFYSWAVKEANALSDEPERESRWEPGILIPVERSVFYDVNNAESVDINADIVRRKPQTEWGTIGSAVLVSANLIVRLQLSQRLPSCFSQQHVEEFCSVSAFI